MSEGRGSSGYSFEGLAAAAGLTGQVLHEIDQKIRAVTSGAGTTTPLLQLVEDLIEEVLAYRAAPVAKPVAISSATTNVPLVPESPAPSVVPFPTRELIVDDVPQQPGVAVEGVSTLRTEADAVADVPAAIDAPEPLAGDESATELPPPAPER